MAEKPVKTEAQVARMSTQEAIDFLMPPGAKPEKPAVAASAPAKPASASQGAKPKSFELDDNIQSQVREALANGPSMEGLMTGRMQDAAAVALNQQSPSADVAKNQAQER